MPIQSRRSCTFHIPTKRSVLLPTKRCYMRTSHDRLSRHSTYADDCEPLLDEIKEVSMSDTDNEEDDLDLLGEHDAQSTCSEAIDDPSDTISHSGGCDPDECTPSTTAAQHVEEKSCPKPTLRIKKTVRFAPDPSSDDVVCKFYSDYLPIHKSEHKKVWHQRVDFQRYRSESAQSVYIARESLTVAKLYDACASSKKLRALTREETVAVSESDHRGLEAPILHESLVRDRRVFIQQLLELQQRSLDALWTADERVEALATQSLAQTKQSRRFAHVLGSGDAVVAQQCLLVSRHEIFSLVPVAEFCHWTPLWMQRTAADDSLSLDSIHLCEL